MPAFRLRASSGDMLAIQTMNSRDLRGGLLFARALLGLRRPLQVRELLPSAVIQRALVSSCFVVFLSSPAAMARMARRQLGDSALALVRLALQELEQLQHVVVLRAFLDRRQKPTGRIDHRVAATSLTFASMLGTTTAMIRITGNERIPIQNVFVRRFSVYSRSATARSCLNHGRSFAAWRPPTAPYEDFVQRRLALVEAAHLHAGHQVPQQHLRIGSRREEQFAVLPESLMRTTPGSECSR